MNELLSLAAAFIIHELGHLIAARLLGVRAVSFGFNGVGACLTFDFSRSSYHAEILVHLSGGLLPLITAYPAYLLLHEKSLCYIGLSLSLAAVNYLPIRGFDGGGICLAALSCFCLPDRAEKICSVISGMSSVLLWLFAVLYQLRSCGNLGLLLFSLVTLVSSLLPSYKIR